jgi:hypothetical protein
MGIVLLILQPQALLCIDPDLAIRLMISMFRSVGYSEYILSQ